MAFITKEQVKEKTVKIKAIAKNYGCKVSVSGSNSSTITVRFTEGKIDFWQNAIDTAVANQRGNVQDIKDNMQFSKEHGSMNINHHWMDTHYSGEVLQMLQEIKAVLMIDHYDYSDAMTDYFNCAWYINIQVGRWDKPYKLLDN